MNKLIGGFLFTHKMLMLVPPYAWTVGWVIEWIIGKINKMMEDL